MKNYINLNPMTASQMMIWKTKKHQNESFKFCHAKTGCLDSIRCMEAGCRACGNPAYPECKTSCPLFDD